MGKYAFLGKGFSDAGFDFVGMDQRGFGHSEGARGIFESCELLMSDLLTHIDKVDEVFGGPDVPKFLLGYSLGGLQCPKIAALRPDFFKGMGLIAPGFGDKKDKRPFLEQLEATLISEPGKIYTLSPMPTLPPAHSLNFMFDPLTAGI